jgi:hypothetical protein
MPFRSIGKSALHFLLALLLAALPSCKDSPPKQDPASPSSARADDLARVGSLVITEQDLQHRLTERHARRNDPETRQAALEELVAHARFAQAALDAGMADDALLRSEMGRLLESRLRETELAPKLAAITEIPEARLRAAYEADLARFQAPERRQVAALWMDPGPDPARAESYVAKMAQARDFMLKSEDLMAHPEKGFSILGADYSEHQASRYRNGEIGWLEREGAFDPWSKAVAAIAFALETKGAISEVITRPEGIFLVRLMDIRPAVTRPFESVAAELERAERTRLHREIEAEFEQSIRSRYPVEWLQP